MAPERGLIAAIKADLLAHDRMAIGPGWVPEGRGPGAWWWRYRRNHHAAGVMILYRLREWAQGVFLSSNPLDRVTMSVRRSGPPIDPKLRLAGKRMS